MCAMRAGGFWFVPRGRYGAASKPCWMIVDEDKKIDWSTIVPFIYLLYMGYGVLVHVASMCNHRNKYECIFSLSLPAVAICL